MKKGVVQLCFSVFFLFIAFNTRAQDTDGDLVLDVVDLDDDNDGILDEFDCQFQVPNFGFESPVGPPYYVAADNWSIVGGNGWGTHDVQPANNYPNADDGVQFLFINTNPGVVGEVITNNPLGVYSEGGYLLTIAVGDGIDAINSFRNDAQSIIELGYGNDAASFTPIPGGARIIDGATETAPGIWTDFQVSLTLNTGNVAIGEGILIRITHTGIAGATAGNYDNVRLELDSDGDGISNCLEVDSDNDGINDVVEAGHIDVGGGVLANSGINPDGTVIPTGTGYTGNTDDVLDATKDGSIVYDNDGDSYLDGVDLDDDNDGILDSNECEAPITNYSFENAVAPADPITGWSLTNIATSSWGIEPAGVNYFSVPDGTNFAFINGDGIITLDQPGAAFELGDYLVSLEIGDGIEFTNGFSNDGQTIVEVGYDNGTGFTVVDNFTIEGHQTLNGIWTDFSFVTTIPIGSPAIGEGILVRITHTSNGALNQLGGDYDNIRVLKDRNSNGVPDCFENDIDGDGCNDVVEAGHTDAGGGILAGSGINPDGTVIPTGTGYTGLTQAVLSGVINSCTEDLDFDNDLVDDTIDLDDDNDGILDEYECELPIANFSFETDNLPADPIEYWQLQSGAVYGLETITGANFINAPDGTSFGFINGDGVIELNEIWGTYDRQGNYILEFFVGDPIPFDPAFSNDSQTVVRLGYNDGATFNTIPGGDYTVESYDTPNGVWSKFTLTVTINTGDAAFGNGISIQIEHNDTTNGNISQTAFDNFSLKLDTDGDGMSDCMGLDADGDGCNDVVEAGHTDAGGGLLGATVDVNGLVTGAGGYTGPRWQMWDASNAIACNPIDSDGDGVEDGDYFRYDAGNTLQTNIDEDNDNDGISDDEEGCNLINSGFLRQPYNFEVPANNFLLSGTNSPFADTVDYWYDESGTGNAFVVLVNAENYPYPLPTPTTIDDPNYKTDGTLLPDLPDPDYQNDAYLALNGDVVITQTGSRLALEEGGYMLTIAIGDALDIENSFRNDGISIIEIGYDTDTSEGGLNYNPLVTLPQINPEDTPNGTWTDFSFNFEIPTGSPAIGNHLSIRIQHLSNPSLNQESGNYDHIRIQRNTDGILTGDLIPDCLDLDSDEDGCFDSIEAGNPDDDLDGILGTGVPTVNPTNGLVTSVTGYPSPVSADVRTFAEPATITTPLTNPIDVCESEDAILTIVASRTGANPNMVFEWAESTDGGSSWTVLTDIAPYSGTTTATMTISAVTNGQNNNQYRVRVSGDDYACYDEDITVLNVTAGPTAPTVTPTNVQICEGDDAEFTLTGDPNTTVTYTINGGAPQPLVLDGSGNGTVIESATLVDVTIEVLSVQDATCTLNLTPTLVETITVNTPPTLTPDLIQCDPSLTTYFVDFTVSSGVVTSDFGTVIGNRVENIPAGTDVTLTLTDGPCVVTLPITAPNCSCSTIDPPINPIESAICEGGANPPVSIELDPSGLGDTINWYDAPTGGTLLGTGPSYTSTETLPSTYSYYAEAEEAVSGCVSSVRVLVNFTIHATVTADTAIPVTECDSYTLPSLSAGSNYFTEPGGTGTLLNAGDAITSTQTIYIYVESGTLPNCTDENSFIITINETPNLVVDNTSCSADLSTYTITLQPITGTITASVGTVVGNDTVTDIPVGMDVLIDADNNGCTSNILVTAPDCTCPVLDAPVNPVNGSNFEGQPNAALTVEIPASGGTSINWYDAPTGGNLVGSGTSYTPTDTAVGDYFYYAETVGNPSTCTSTSRTEVILSILTAPTVPDCTSLTIPTNMSIDVPVSTDLTWNAVANADGYYITIGTSSGGNDILDAENITGTTFDLPTDLPENTEIFVTIVPYNSVGNAESCVEESFITANENTTLDLPPCTTLSNPENGAFNIPVSTNISWRSVGGADGYILSIGTSAGATDILGNLDVGLTTSYQLSQDLPFGQEIFVSIIPYNSSGQAVACELQSFTTIEETEDVESLFGFSPDGDGNNDYWTINGIEDYPNNTVIIFNRWGDMVFKINGYDNNSIVFRGEANQLLGMGAGQLPEGTYFFQINIPTEHNLKTTQGYLVLKR